MVRLLLIQLALFFLPMALYGLWTLLANRYGFRRVQVPTAILVLAGMALVGGLLWFSTVNAPPPGSTYRPAQWVDGQLIDGTFVRPEEQSQPSPNSTAD